MPDQAHWPPPGGRHRATGLSGPTRRYAFIVLLLAVTSSLPILAAIGPGAGSVGDALAGDDLGDTTPFIPPPSPGPVVVIPIRPEVPERPPPTLATLPAPTGTVTPPRQPTRQTSGKPSAPARRTEATHRRATPEQHRRTRPPGRPAPAPAARGAATAAARAAEAAAPRAHATTTDAEAAAHRASAGRASAGRP